MPVEKILLAADDPEMLAFLAESLEGQGYAVTPAADGPTALAALAAEEFSLALLDLGLPGPSGLELLSRLKDKAPDTEVILIAGDGDRDCAIAALRLGAYDYLLKSALNRPESHAAVARALERRRLAQCNRALLVHLRQAQEELARRRGRELSQVRRIGEVLAGPRTWEQLFQGLASLIWETLPLTVLGLEFLGTGSEKPLLGFRRAPELGHRAFEDFQNWFPEGPPGDPLEAPLPALLQETVRAGEVTARVAAAREAPFTPEEVELFRIFTLQAEAALNNLLLFEQAKSLAIRDGLTGLYNYRYFIETLQNEVEKCRRYRQPLSLLFLDIDDFKIINDTRGHTTGDKVLQKVGALLKNTVRHADLLCRYGGDEFALLLPQTPPAQALMLAERLRALISQTPINTVDPDFRVTVSIGVAGLKAGMGWEDLVRAADEAHYRGKEAGKNRVCGPGGDGGPGE
jgi:two-component system cell cycle response regulator